MEVKAPAILKLFGEHAVVYGKASLAVALNYYAKSVFDKPDELLNVNLLDLGVSGSISRNELLALYNDYTSKEIKEFILSNKRFGQLLPYFTIASRLYASGYDITGSYGISSEIPPQKGLASSAACSTTFAVSLLNRAKAKLSDAEIVDLAREGERVIHSNANAGKIDVSASYFGGYVVYSDSLGVQPQEIKANLHIKLVDTGPKKSTAETVASVKERYLHDRDNTEKIFEEIEKCTFEGLEALNLKDIKKLGELMYKNQELLQKLGVSTEILDSAIATAKENGAYGAKLSGGGGGGIFLLIEESDKASNALQKAGFKVYNATTTFIGAKNYYHYNS
ncbi:MAG: mevalonate kinase [Candidatus Micrarchaeia archaeon]